MEYTEVFFTFPSDLTEAQEAVLIAYMGAIRNRLIGKIDTTLAAMKVAEHIPFNPSKSMLISYEAGLAAIRADLTSDPSKGEHSTLFVLEKVDSSHYKVSLASSLTIKTPVLQSKLLENLVKGFSNRRWCEMLVKEMGVASVKVGPLA
jgi:hypothetical protein